MAELKDLLFYGEPKEDDLRERAEKYDFSSLSPLEHLRWDYEFAAQLQKRDSSFLLKGGAATQLFLEPSSQRGSKDIDILTSSSGPQIEKAMNEIEKDFSKLGMEVRRYEPRNPHPKLPLLTWEAILPGFHTEKCVIKIEFLSEDMKLEECQIDEWETLALLVKNTKCISQGSLVGDKLLTLASKTIGVEVEDRPKQLYDVDSLVYSRGLDKKDVEETIRAVSTIAPVEAQYRELDVTIPIVLDDVAETLSHYSKADISTGDRTVGRANTAFDGYYVARNRALTANGWSCRALRVRLLSDLLKRHVEGKMSLDEVVSSIEKIRRLSPDASNSREDIRPVLVPMLRQNPRPLRGKPVERIIWEVLTIENIDEVADLVRPIS